jgi:hypothetical protein
LLKHPDKTLQRWQTAMPGVGINHEFFFGKLSFFTHFGFYIHLNDYNEQFAYQRFAFRYAASENLRLHLGVKTCSYAGMAADWIELGLGFRIL